MISRCQLSIADVDSGQDVGPLQLECNHEGVQAEDSSREGLGRALALVSSEYEIEAPELGRVGKVAHMLVAMRVLSLMPVARSSSQAARRILRVVGVVCIRLIDHHEPELAQLAHRVSTTSRSYKSYVASEMIIIS
jgi:hypothetical protein